MTDCDAAESQELNRWHYVSMNHLSDKQLHDLVFWLKDQEGGKFYWSLIKGFWFERAEDHMLCVMSWK